MLKIDARGLAGQLSELSDLQTRQLPFATAVALTRTAEDVKSRLEEELRLAFDRPTRWTLNSLRLIPARKDRLEARVWIKDEADKAAPATRWLAPQVYGGNRRDKRSEAMLKARGILPDRKFIVPGEAAELDQFGNISRGYLTRILSGIGGFTELGYDANARDSKRSNSKGNARSFFVVRRGRELIGIGERSRWGKGSRSSWKMVLAFVSRPTYRQRFDFFSIAQRTADEMLPRRFEEAMSQAVATARR